MGDAVAYAVVFVGFPLLFVWSLRDSLRVAHVVVLLLLAVACACLALLAWRWGRDAGPGWGALGPGIVLLAAGGAGGVFLSAAVMSVIALVLRDPRDVDYRRELQRYSKEPRRPSLQPFSPSELDFRLLLTTVIAAMFSLGGVVTMLVSESVPNFLRIVGLYRGPDDPRVLSFAQAPVPYTIQLLVCAALAVGLSAWAVYQYLRANR